MAQFGPPGARQNRAKKSARTPLIVLAFLILFGIIIGGNALSAPEAPSAKQDVSAAQIPSGDDAATPRPAAEATPSQSPAGASDRTPSPEVKENAAPTAPPDPSPAGTSQPSDETSSQSNKKPQAGANSALAVAQQLTVKGRAPKTGYSRSVFGSAWKDIDRNGCDQRNDILNRDLTAIVYKPGTRDCVVLTGKLIDPFSGKTIHFERGQKTSHKVQIDHVVALSDAWQKGAQQWNQPKREQFANDPLNLLAVDGPLNAQKGDGDVATWLPPNKSFRCQYVAQIVGVKHAYSLWVTQAEQDAMVRVLTACPDEPVPTGKIAPDVKPQQEPAPKSKASSKPKPKASSKPKPKASSKPKPSKQPAPKPSSPSKTNVYYKNCTAVWDAIGGPISKGEPGYAKHLDRDGDGVGCEYKPR